MAGRIAKLLKRQTPERPELVSALASLAHLAEARPDLRQAAILQSALMQAVYAAPIAVSPCPLTAEDGGNAAGRWYTFAPQYPAPLYGSPPAGQCFCAYVQRPRPSKPRPPQRRCTAWLQKRSTRPALISGPAAIGCWRVRHTCYPQQLAAQGYPADLLLTLLRLSLLPCLEQTAVQLTSWYNHQAWGRGYCPACGAWPVLAEQRGLEQRRYLRCGLCASAWEVDRLLCPFCGNRDHLLLGISG